MAFSHCFTLVSIHSIQVSYSITFSVIEYVPGTYRFHIHCMVYSEHLIHFWGCNVYLDRPHKPVLSNLASHLQLTDIIYEVIRVANIHLDTTVDPKSQFLTIIIHTCRAIFSACILVK